MLAHSTNRPHRIKLAACTIAPDYWHSVLATRGRPGTDPATTAARIARASWNTSRRILGLQRASMETSRPHFNCHGLSQLAPTFKRPLSDQRSAPSLCRTRLHQSSSGRMRATSSDRMAHHGRPSRIRRRPNTSDSSVFVSKWPNEHILRYATSTAGESIQQGH